MFYSFRGDFSPGVRPYKEGRKCSQCLPGATCKQGQCVGGTPPQQVKSAQPKKPAEKPKPVQPKKPADSAKPKDASKTGANQTGSPNKSSQQGDNKKMSANSSQPVGRAGEEGPTTTSAGAHLHAMYLLIPVLIGFATSGQW